MTWPSNYIMNCRHCHTVKTFCGGDPLDLDIWRKCWNGRCAVCGACAGWTRVNGRVTEHECDARCMGAKGPTCDCSCGGKNHGINYA